jgi:predicted nucleic acid-binding protein
VSALNSAEGTSRAVLRGVFSGLWTPLISLSLFLEYEDVLGRPLLSHRSRISETESQEFLDEYLSLCSRIEMYFAWRPNLRDEGDNHIFELAVAAQDATILTWNLRDFASAELRFPHIKIQTPADWLKEMH